MNHTSEPRTAKAPAALHYSPEDIRHMALVVEHSTDVIVLTDTKGHLTWANPAFSKLTGYALEDILGKKPGSILQGSGTDPETRKRIGENLKRRTPVRAEILNYSKTGTPYWVELHISPIYDEDGKHTNFMSVERDITDRKRLEQIAERQQVIEEQRRIERRLLSEISEWLYACKSIDELLDVVSKGMEKLIPEADGCLYLYSNSRDVLEGACSWNGAKAEQTIEADDCWALRKGRAYTYGVNQLSFSCAHAEQDPPYPYFCLPIIAHGDTIGLMHLSFKNITLADAKTEDVQRQIENHRELALIYAEQVSLAIANVRLRDELRDQSVRDPMTGLLNRRWFMDNCRRELTHSVQRRQPLSLISLDVDQFKAFNDNFGHDAGDLVLRHVAQTLAEHCDGPATACRIGGEEFVVLAPGFGLDKATELAEWLRVKVADIALNYAGQALPRVTVSAGVAQVTGPVNSIQGLMQAADEALYAAKRGGRDRVVACTKAADNGAAPRGSEGSGAVIEDFEVPATRHA